MDITIFQGSRATIDAKTSSSIFVMTDGMNKYTSDAVISTDDGYKISLDASVTSGFIPGSYTYQVVNGEGLESQGKLKVKPNLLYTDSIESYWKKVLNAIDERLAGKTSDSAESITVGDKSIRYMSIDELLKLRAFALQKLAEEDEEVVNPNNEKRIIYKWRLR